MINSIGPQIYTRWSETFMMTAKLIGDRHATCARVKVGCVIAKDHRIISIGYNGVASKQEHCIDKFATMVAPTNYNINEHYTDLFDVLNLHDVISANDYNVRVYDKKIGEIKDKNSSVIFEWKLSPKAVISAKAGDFTLLKSEISDAKADFFNSDGFKTLHREWSMNNEVHAEANAISFAAKNGINIKDASLYCTITPCKDCAKFIVASGITKVFYNDVYDREDTRPYFAQNGIETIEIKL